jgi:hypothetical protein
MLVAWDPVAQEPRWTVEHPGPWNGGLLATAGGLVFQGTAGSEFNAYNATNGEKLWSFPAQTGVVAPPVTYTIDGEQYVAVLAGWGGAYALSVDGQAIRDLAPVRNISRLIHRPAEQIQRPFPWAGKNTHATARFATHQALWDRPYCQTSGARVRCRTRLAGKRLCVKACYRAAAWQILPTA